MPPKLQVDESFAFLFTCIEASGCKVGRPFKLVSALVNNSVQFSPVRGANLSFPGRLQVSG